MSSTAIRCGRITQFGIAIRQYLAWVYVPPGTGSPVAFIVDMCHLFSSPWEHVWVLPICDTLCRHGSYVTAIAYEFTPPHWHCLSESYHVKRRITIMPTKEECFYHGFVPILIRTMHDTERHPVLYRDLYPIRLLLLASLSYSACASLSLSLS